MIAQSRLLTTHSLGKLKVGTLLTNIILAVLILVPSINYFGKCVLFNLAGIEITLRFLVLVSILGILAFSLIIGRMVTIPHQLVVSVFFVVWVVAPIYALVGKYLDCSSRISLSLPWLPDSTQIQAWFDACVGHTHYIRRYSDCSRDCSTAQWST